VDGKLENLRGTLSKVFEAADTAKRPTNEIADEMARQRLGLV
jgi:leucine dehydrogenase